MKGYKEKERSGDEQREGDGMGWDRIGWARKWTECDMT